jgi:cbb3-type cytochrome oxidase subunit 3
MRREASDTFATVSSRVARWLAATLALAALWSPRIVWACSVCSAGRDEANRVAFIATTAFLTFLPLLMIGGVVWWLFRRARRHADGADSVVQAQRAPAAARTAKA